MSTKMLLITGIVVLVAVGSSHSFNYCVSETEICNKSLSNCTQHCHRLMWYVNNTQDIENNTEIIFLPGNHNLNSNGVNHAVLNFTWKNSFNLTGNYVNDSTASTVVCNGDQSGFLFQYSTNIYIGSITFRNCRFLLSNKTSALSLIDSKDILISYVSIIDFRKKPLRNILLLFETSQEQNSSTINNLVIEHSTLMFRKHEQKGKGLYLNILTPKTTVTINNITVMNSSSTYGGNIEIITIDFEENPNQFTITESRILSGKAKHGGGIYFIFERNEKEYIQQKNNTSIVIKNTVFEGNRATKSGGAFRLQTDDFQVHSNIQIYNCVFKKNSAKTGGAILIQALRVPTHLQHTGPQVSVIFDNCTVSENNLELYNDHDNGFDIVCLYSLDKVIIRNTNFTKNNGTALLLVSTTVLFKNTTLFSHNSAAYGGAMRLCDGSMFFLYNETNIEFESNTATVSGGAIYAEDNCIQLTPICFYQVDSMHTKLNRETLNFKNNTASYAGDAIYGGSINTCYFLKQNYPNGQRKELTWQLFQISPKTVSMVSSRPYRVCLCNPITGEPNCTKADIEIKPKYPGQVFNIFVAAIGQRNGTVPAVLNVTSDFNVTHNRLPPIEKCQLIKLTVFSAPNMTATVNISLSNNIPIRHFINSDLKIKIPIISCPWVFDLNKEGNSCNCSKIFNQHHEEHESCSITSMSINHITANWINCTKDTLNYIKNLSHSKCDEIEIGRFCTHCKGGTFTPYNLSDQCIVGREGRLCGHCKANYSYSLGPSICLTNENCSMWKTIIFLIIFFLVGILFVCFLALLNVTVTEGTINGMLFFTTCIHVNQDIFFHERYGNFNTILRVAISWLNLDLGITICFYKGMSAYSKQWMEFTFLFYLLLIAIIIVFLSNRSMWFTRLTGHNIVPVLSTVLLFSYSKIIKNCVKVFDCTLNRYTSTKNKTRLIWAQDETIDCFTGSHIPLSLCAILFLAAALFYNFCLLFSQCLQRRSHWWMLRWVNKLRPFFEANTGPCRDQYRFWPGFILLLRLGMTIYSCAKFIQIQPKKREAVITATCFLTLSILIK